ncbi:MAG: fumarylacetoacetate hydrolase family protein [Burkholderiales bacterium]|nr:fumarylacetoacetate hydrolase family protein [Burkholderiales bacterium]
MSAVMPALELADDRNADYAQLRAHALTLVADNAWNEGVVLGEPLRDWRSVDLAALRGVALIDGAPLGEGTGRDVMGHPLEALAWLANHLAARGLSLWRSDVVITGSLIRTHFARPGERIRFEAGPLGAVALSVE